MSKEMVRAKRALLEVLGVIRSDGAYADEQFLEQELRALGATDKELAATEAHHAHN